VGGAAAAAISLQSAQVGPAPVNTTPAAANGPGGSPAITPGGTPGATPGAGTAPGNRPGAATGPGSLAATAGLDLDHLLRRTTYGPTDELRAQVRGIGIPAWLTRQLAPAAIPDPGGDAVARLYPELRFSAAQARRAFTTGREVDRFQRMLGAAHLGRAVWSSRQLQEVMVGFWSEHLNITVPNEKSWESRHLFDRAVVRRHALGRFEDMLIASAEHPAMLAYLDNRDSTGEDPNENYARELLELHTVGVGGGYTERDVKQAALLLTGWQVTDGVARYVPARHYAGPVRIMGFRHPNTTRAGGRAAAAAFLRYLAGHPSTARFLARKLAVRFVSDDPPAALVDRLARTYLDGRTAIPPVLVALFGSPEFAASAGQKLRTPLERLVAAARVLDVAPGNDPDGLLDLYWMLDESGNLPLNWPLPNGYPDVASAWQSPALGLNQFNTMISLTHGWWPSKLPLKGDRLLPSPPATSAAIVTATSRKILGRPPTDQERAAAEGLLATSGLRLEQGWDRGEAVNLVATLLLNSPAHIVR
jgi:uncharacterized protein (DUF1800 family)